MAPGPKHLTTGDSLPPLKPGVLRIYSMKFCPFAERTRLVLAAKGIEHEVVNINTYMKPEWLVTKNPKQLVPVLEKDGQIVYESLITSYYLEHLYPDKNPLAPKDPYLNARDQMLFDSFSKVLGVYYTAVKTKDALTTQACADAFKHVEDELQERGGDFFFGSKPGMVDYMIWPTFVRVRASGIFGEGKDVPDELSVLAGWVQRMRLDPVVQTTIHPDSAYVTFSKNYRTENSMFDEIETPN